MLGIYIHIPFCERKCNYCAFSSFVTNEEERKRYIKALINEISDFKEKIRKEIQEKLNIKDNDETIIKEIQMENVIQAENDVQVWEGEKFNFDEKYSKIDTVYIGGGTPSLLEGDEIEEIAKAIKDNFVLSDDYEWTIECNPNSLTDEKLQLYKKVGINRISIGVQSLKQEALEFIGRFHDREGAITAIKMAKRYFDNVSCDLLIGLKGVSQEEFLEGLKEIVDLGVTHVSAYMLQVEEGTPLAKMVKNNPHLLPEDDECVEIYEKTTNFLEKNGFERYEVSNFAKKGYECKHNLKYWSGEEYAGFGSSAHSLICSTRYASADRLDDYYIGKRKMIERLGVKEKIEEHIMLGFRCKLGVSKKYLLSLGYDIEKCQTLDDFITRGVVIDDGDRLFINPKFYGVNNYVIASLLP